MNSFEGMIMVRIEDKCETCRDCFNCTIQDKLRSALVDTGERVDLILTDCEDYKEERNLLDEQANYFRC